MRKLNKRDCRRLAVQEWKTDRNRGLFMAESVEYIVRTAVKIVGRQKTLVLYLYPTKSEGDGPLVPAYTLFQGQEDYITLVRNTAGELVWRTSKLDHMDGDYRFVDKCTFFSRTEEQRVLRYCGIQAKHGFSALSRLQEQIKNKRELERRHAKQRLIIAKMTSVPPMPRGVKEWLRREIMPAYIFYDYQRKGTVQGYCTACQHIVEVQPKHNQDGVCPHCGRLVKFKSRGKRGYMNDRETVVIVQRIDRQTLLLRVLKVYVSYRKEDLAEQSISESIRIFCSVGELGQYCEEVFHHCHERDDLTPWKPGYPPVRYLYQENYYANTCGHLFCRDLDKELKGTPWEYSQLKEFYLSDHIPLSVETFLKKAVAYPQIEMLLKMGHYGFAADFIYRHVPYSVNASEKKPHRFFGIQPEEWRFLLQRGLNKDELAMMQHLNEHKISYKQRIELFLWCRQHDVESYLVHTALQRTTPAKMMGYVQKQYALLKDSRTSHGQSRYVGLKEILREYGDYLRLCQCEDCNMKDSIILFPKNVKKAHDRLIKRIKVREDKAKQEKFQRVLEHLGHQLDFEYEGLAIMQPARMEDLVAEGKALSHCVGGYIDSMADNRCVILFIRRKAELEKPFYTVEVQNDQVRQVKGFKNGSATPEVEEFMAVWEEQVLKKRLPAAA